MLNSFKLALKSIWSNRLRSFLTMLGIIIGVAAVTSSLGGFIGIDVGFVGTSAAGKIRGIDASPTFLSVLVSFMVSVMIGLIFGYLPARRAAALNPIDALRSD